MASHRSGLPAKRASAMQPPRFRPANSRAASVTPSLNGRVSPTESVASSRAPRSPATSNFGGTKRKQRDFEQEGNEETNINVVVRCRGRNDREVRENSGVVVSTKGTMGQYVDLSMGPNALSNKTYHFDKVFSPAADQAMIFDEVVAPILSEVMSGFNCTIFAYGQTGTGKTYTMSGEIADARPLPDDAGIVPRVLHSLFEKLDAEEAESSVKISFIELYNEELRDLLAADDNGKLKIYDNNNQKGHSSTLVQGMEESHIKTAAKGIQLLRTGSHRRQVAATKCNDLSSRSHTIFTITVYTKRTSETGEDFVCNGKLNLVDLAGSENIQRSGAENKRATEAGLINKSLLTLGRVINALVDKAPHIPYRESKLTRLLQDSLGGRTKTCIIATLSPAKSNLEETISTLDYAFRAKNIRNKPQVNAMVSKKTLLKEFTAEIEKLKSELIATRQRNGVYLAQDSYEELMTESESRRILSEEQREKIENLEKKLRNKYEELFSLTSSFNNLKKDNEATKLILDGTKSILEKTEVVLAHTRQNLAEEETLRKAHQKTEEDLASIGQDLISTLGKTTSDIGGLHSKLRRRSDLQSLNRQNWASSQTKVSTSTLLAEKHIDAFRAEQESLMERLSARMQSFVQQELQNLEASQSFLMEKMNAYEVSEKEVNEQTTKARDEMDEVLEEIKTLREDVKQKVGAGLNDLSAAAQRISAGIATELEAFQLQLHTSYASLGKEFKSSFDDLLKTVNDQRTEGDALRKRIVEADMALVAANKSTQSQLNALMEEEKARASEERQQLLAQITNMINSTAEAQESRLQSKLSGVSDHIEIANSGYNVEHEAYNHGMDALYAKTSELSANVAKARDNVKARIQADFAAANSCSTSLQATTASVHESTVRIVEEQMAQMDTQLHSLDEIISRVRAQNNDHHAAHTSSLASLASTVQTSYSNIGEHFTNSFTRIQELNSDMDAQTAALRETLPNLGPDAEIQRTLRNLREDIESQALAEYAPTGETPQRTQYMYPSTLPRTEGREALLSRLRSQGTKAEDSAEEKSRSPNKTVVFTDAPEEDAKADADVNSTTDSNTPANPADPIRPVSATSALSLRELDVNVLSNENKPDMFSNPAATQSSDAGKDSDMLPPPFKRVQTSANTGSEKNSMESKLPMKKATRMTVAAGALDRENVPVSVDFSKSVGPGSAPSSGRRLRSHGST